MIFAKRQVAQFYINETSHATKLSNIFSALMKENIMR